MSLPKQFLLYIEHELGYSPRTVEAYDSDLTQWINYATAGDPDKLDALSVTVDDLRTWVAEVARRGSSPRTIRRKVSSLRAFFRYLMKVHGMKTNPAEGLSLPRPPKDIPVYIRESETRRIISQPEVSDDFIPVRDHLILDLFYTTGLRCSELMSLRDAAVDTVKGELKVVGKRSKERVIPFGKKLGEAIDRYRDLRDSNPRTAVCREDPSAPLLVKSDGQSLYRRMVYNVVHTRLSEGGAHAQRLSPHVLRHSCATDMLNAGAPISSVQEMLGHSSLASTQVYTHVTYTDLKDNYQFAHPRAQKKGGPDEY